MKGEKLPDDDIRKRISEIDSPLMHLHYGGYRAYYNTKNWTCHFCGELIEVNRGYWGHKKMNWSPGAKLCHKCFLKFLTIMKENEYLMLLFEKMRGKELKVLDLLALK